MSSGLDLEYLLLFRYFLQNLLLDPLLSLKNVTNRRLCDFLSRYFNIREKLNISNEVLQLDVPPLVEQVLDGLSVHELLNLLLFFLADKFAL